MGRRINGHEDVAQALALLEQATVLLDAAGLIEIAVHADYAKQLLDQNLLMTRGSVIRRGGMTDIIDERGL